jgi:hypothetical protein
MVSTVDTQLSHGWDAAWKKRYTNDAMGTFFHMDMSDSILNSLKVKTKKELSS